LLATITTGNSSPTYREWGASCQRKLNELLKLFKKEFEEMKIMIDKIMLNTKL